MKGMPTVAMMTIDSGSPAPRRARRKVFRLLNMSQRRGCKGNADEAFARLSSGSLAGGEAGKRAGELRRIHRWISVGPPRDPGCDKVGGGPPSHGGIRRAGLLHGYAGGWSQHEDPADVSPRGAA